MRKPALSAAVLSVALLAGCGSATDKPAGNAPSATSAPADKSGAATFDSLAKLNEAVAAKTADVKGAHVVMKGTANSATVLEGAGDFSYASDKIAMQMTMKVGNEDVSVRLVDNVMYLKTPEPIEPGKTWLKLDLSDPSNPLVASLGESLSSAQESDPRKILAQLARSGQIKSAKPEELEGKKAVHYSVLVDLTKVADKDLGMSKESIAELTKAGVKEIPVEIWVDEAALPLRVITEVPNPQAKMTVQADYTDWGKAIEVTAPPAAEVAELPKN